MLNTMENGKTAFRTSEFRVPRPAFDRERRHFMRHPTTLSVACRCLGHSDFAPSSVRDASLGGLSFVSDCLFAEGDLLNVSFPVRLTTAQFNGVVIWRQDIAGGQAGRHAYGVRFCDQEMFPRIQLLEQICHIEVYRNTQAAQCNRRLSSSRAAGEWIAKYAARFPS